MKQYDSIKEFLSIKDKCVFCNTKMRNRLTCFNSFDNYNIPLINAEIKSNEISFSFNHTTEHYSIKPICNVDISTNRVEFYNDANTKSIDQYLARSVLEGLNPIIEIYCANKKCKMMYYICSDILKMNNIINTDFSKSIDYWKIYPLKIYLESVKASNFILHNDYIKSYANIYSAKNQSAEPIKVPLIDLELMTTEKLINRINTIVVFG